MKKYSDCYFQALFLSSLRDWVALSGLTQGLRPGLPSSAASQLVFGRGFSERAAGRRCPAGNYPTQAKIGVEWATRRRFAIDLY